GRADGMAAGEAQAWERVRAVVQGMEQGLAAWHAAAPEREAIARENLIALATGIAKHVIGRELKTDARAIADLVRRALAHFPLREPVRIRLNPADLTAISTATDGAVRIATGRSVEWHADPELATGDCVVEAARRVVDGRVDRALERIYTKLIDALYADRPARGGTALRDPRPHHARGRPGRRSDRRRHGARRAVPHPLDAWRVDRPRGGRRLP